MNLDQIKGVESNIKETKNIKNIIAIAGLISTMITGCKKNEEPISSGGGGLFSTNHK